MKKSELLRNFFLLVIFCVPLYLVRIAFSGAPSNILELFALTAVMLFFIKERRTIFEKIAALPKMLLVGSAMIIVGVLFSVLFNDAYRAGFGIFKGWFAVPMLFSFSLYALTDSEDYLEKIFESIYFSITLVSLIALTYKLSGVLTYDNRLSAFYLSPNHLAMYLAPGFFFGLYFLHKSFSSDGFSKNTFFYSLTQTMILVALYLTYSYGAWLAITIALLMLALFFVKIKRQLMPYLLISLLFVLALFFSQLGTQKFEDALHVSQRSSLASRLMIWKSSFELIKQNPVLGIGPGNFQTSYLALQKNYPPYLEWAVPQPHNIFLAFWLQAGMIGFVGFLMLLSFIFKTLWLLLKDKKSAAFAATLLGFFLYTMLHGLIDTPYWKNDLSFLFWIFAFITIFLNKHFSEK